ncbi:MAG: pilus assembly protein TadG-related protein [Boseongicola sp.]
MKKRTITLNDVTEDFVQSTSGAITVMNIFFLMVVAILAGIAIDTASLVQARTQLQVAADTAAHAAMYTRDQNDAATAKAKGLEVALHNMPSARFGTILDVNDIHFGTYDAATAEFTIDETSTTAVYVKTGRLSDTANPVTAFLLQFIGQDEFDVVATSVYAAVLPPCYNDGWLARQRVDAQSNNSFADDFCLYSDTQIEMNNHNSFVNGTTVSAPYGADDITVPSGGWTSNPGLLEAVRVDHMTLSILNKFDVVEANLANPNSRFDRSYLTTTAWTNVPASNKMDQTDFPAGGMYNITGCPGPGVTLETDISSVVLKFDCKVKIANGIAFEDVVLINYDTGANSFSATNNLRLGVDDNCDPDGGAILVLYGGADLGQGLQIFSSQVLAHGDVEFAAQGNGVEGGSIISAGEIDGTSLTNMSGCPGSLLDGYAFYFPEYKLRG